MRPTFLGRSHALKIALALATATLIPGFANFPALATSPAQAPSSTDRVITLGDPVVGAADLDTRGRVQPTAGQRLAARSLGAVDVRWNRYGTPGSLYALDGSLSPARARNPVRAARTWLTGHASLFGLTTGQIQGLELVNNQRFAQSPARAVLFRQKFGDLASATDGMVTVGVAHHQIVYVSSTLAKASGAPQPATLTPLTAWLAGAASVGRSVPQTKIAGIHQVVQQGWTRLTVPGFNDEQQVRLRALAMADGRVRPAYVVNVLDNQGAELTGYTVLVDGVSGAILWRHNRVQHENDTIPVQGDTTATECGPLHKFPITDDATKSIAFVASFVIPSNDIVLKLYGPRGTLLSSEDVGFSPEVLTYSAASIPAGDYAVQACPLPGSANPVFLEPGTYGGVVVLSDSPTPQANTPFPRWRYFTANPTPNTSTTEVPKNSVIGCWINDTGCSKPPGALENPASVGPWDHDFTTGFPTFTTTGNNAMTREAWTNPLAPGALGQAPVSPTRDYTQPFTDAWQNSKCDPSNLVPTGNDIDASVTNLFVAHNRMHDFAYYLGFTERNYNLQQSNHGRVGDRSRENDPEFGQSQAGALSGGAPSYLGRDNANQRTMQDGIPGITNQYLFQPIAGAFYSPCTDGGLDMGIVGHEYTHAISNRMIAGPDDSINSEQGGAMGESWSDLTAAEYMFANNYSNGGNVWAVGAYATGNLDVAIRDYAINHNPLNYSDYGFDLTGPEVHADGEIWNGTQWSVRQALVSKWNAQFPAGNEALQQKCAEGKGQTPPLPVTSCPGNRRWIQLVFDAYLLQQGDTSMLDARDAMLAADQMRFGGENQKAMWDAFAERGMGKDAATASGDATDVTPSFASPRADNARVTFRSHGKGSIYVGQYEARSAPVADTNPGTDLSDRVQLVPGNHEMLFVSKRGGFKRFVVSVRPGDTKTVTIRGKKNLAAAAAGAKVIDSSAGSLNAPWLIDGTEATAWGGISTDNVDTTNPFVTVDLAGGVHEIRRVQVSAMLNPAPADPTALPLAADPDSGSRFTALRRFALEACVSDCSSPRATWNRFYVSSADAFPARQPRPVAPNLILRSFTVPATRAAAIRFVTLENQCTGFKGYAGEQDSDPTNDTDCKAASDRGTIVHAAELQVY